MSYILDALRKSEQERQRGKVPDFHGGPAATVEEQSKSLNLWAMIAIGVVLINVILVGVFWNKMVPGVEDHSAEATLSESSPKEAEQASEVITTQKPPQKAPVASQSIKAVDAIEATANTKPVEKKADAKAEKPELAQPQYETIAPGQSEYVDEIDPEQDGIGAVPQMAYVPQLEELSSFEQQNIPDMTFSSHMYSSIPKYRSVIINGKRLKEGQRYNGDIVVREITETGVVMSQGAVLFQVDVLGRWAQ